MTINVKNKQEIVKKFGKNEKDTGLPEVQIALLSEKINELTEQLENKRRDDEMTSLRKRVDELERRNNG